MEESLQDKSEKQKQKTINKEYMIELKHSWWENHQKKKKLFCFSFSSAWKTTEETTWHLYVCVKP